MIKKKKKFPKDERENEVEEERKITLREEEARRLATPDEMTKNELNVIIVFININRIFTLLSCPPKRRDIINKKIKNYATEDGKKYAFQHNS